MFRRPKETKNFQKKMEKVRQVEDNNKPMYKMKMFSGAESKVNTQVKGFKTYDKKYFKNAGDLDNLISKVESDIKEFN
jgi:hypothetical protein